MNEEELFCKLFPEYTVNGKPLSPYFDFFESGYEQAENHISKLKKENAGLRADYAVLSCSVGDFAELQDRLEEEQRKNNILEEQLTKAKEHIRKLLLVADNKVSQMEFQLCVADAKQFLSEVE